nr:LOW QUALITY PROTEIN: WD repeat-containing protein 49-like [Odocoileus virginianus texanus]
MSALFAHGSPHEPHPMVSHKEPVVCCRYNPTFRQVISCSEASVVKVWDFETGRLLSEFTGAHGTAGITCLTFDSSGRRLVTGGRDGCLKIWSYNSGHCLHTLRHDGEQGEVCDCTYLEVNQNKCIIAVEWERRIDVYFDTPCDFHHFRKPQPHWQDDLNHGHKEDILCVAHCPPSLLATSSYDGEIIIWNVISGHVYCKLNSPSSSDGTENREVEASHPGAHRLKEGETKKLLSYLLTPKQLCPLWLLKAQTEVSQDPGSQLGISLRFPDGQRASSVCIMIPVCTCLQSRDKARVSSMVVTAGDACAYVADQRSFVHVYDIEEYGLQGQELQLPTNVTFWRTHVSMVTLELIEEILLSSSLDRTVHLWSRDGAFIGTFGQSSPWDIFTPASWSHPRVPHEVLTDPQSMPAHPVLEGGVPATCRGEEQDKVAEGKASAEVGPGTYSSPGLAHSSRQIGTGYKLHPEGVKA